MTHRSRKYVVDSQLFIDGFRSPAGRQALEAFHSSFAPYEYLSVIVAQELLAGALRRLERAMVERHVLRVFDRAGRMITPSARAWRSSGHVFGEMARREGLEVARVSKAFANDVLLALSCRETGSVLVTENQRDFRRIRRFVDFEFVEPWPKPPA